jgi:hypothetical protein
MRIDLDDIERRIKDGVYGDDWLTENTQYDACAALAEIIAEVERLRAEVAAERAAVVAWLRKKSDEWSSGPLDDVSGFIESGEHRREGGEEVDRG